MRKFWQPRYFVLTLVAGALVLMGVRLESLAHGLLYGTAVESIAEATAEDAPDKPAASEGHAESGGKPASDVTKTAESPAPALAAAPEQHSETLSGELSEGEVDVLKQLSSRRTMLDDRERELQQKTAILQAAEMRVDQKVKDMEKLRNQLQAMLGQLDEQQQAQIDNLVKIYEAMKPKEAARILQTLDLPVLLGVMRQMKPAKTAPILAEMDSPKAKEVTMTLAKQHVLPDMQAAQ